MNRIRIGNSVIIRFELTTNGLPLPLEGRDIKVILRDRRGTDMELPFVTEGVNVVLTRFEGYDQKLTGKYIIEVWENKGKPSQAVLDFDALELVPRSNQV